MDWIKVWGIVRHQRTWSYDLLDWMPLTGFNKTGGLAGHSCQGLNLVANHGYYTSEEIASIVEMVIQNI